MYSTKFPSQQYFQINSFIMKRYFESAFSKEEI